MPEYALTLSGDAGEMHSVYPSAEAALTHLLLFFGHQNVQEGIRGVADVLMPGQSATITVTLEVTRGDAPSNPREGLKNFL